MSYKFNPFTGNLDLVGAGGNLDGLSDVVISSPSTNQTLLFNGTQWVNAAPGTTFTFSISSFSDSQSSTIEISTGEWKAIGELSYTASYANGPADATPYVSHTGWSNLNMTGATYGGPTASVEAVNYPANVGSLTWTLHASKGATNATSTLTRNFYNRRYWGVSSVASGYTSSDVLAFTSSEVSNSGAKSITSLSIGSGEYFVWASRTALGTRTFKDTDTGFGIDMQAPETVSVTSALGFTENFYVYRSTYQNIGTLNISVS